MDELEGQLKKAIEKFKAKIEEDAALKAELAEITRNVIIDTTDNEGFSFIIEKGQVKDFKRGKLDSAEITLHATTADFKALFTGELKPMKAWATKRLKFDASIDDVMRLKKLIS
ncbi:MAG: SCP2 sterol-binding domain-containing protein [Thermoplasmata archaeon]|nr:SCP2 sterol-binding domain-containing protein [Thermoplasmata archaeon]